MRDLLEDRGYAVNCFVGDSTKANGKYGSNASRGDRLTEDIIGKPTQGQARGGIHRATKFEILPVTHRDDAIPQQADVACYALCVASHREAGDRFCIFTRFFCPKSELLPCRR